MVRELIIFNLLIQIGSLNVSIKLEENFINEISEVQKDYESEKQDSIINDEVEININLDTDEYQMSDDGFSVEQN